MGITGGLPWREVGPYAVAQIVGGCLGTLVAHGMFDLPLLQLAAKARTGSGAMVCRVRRHLRAARDDPCRSCAFGSRRFPFAVGLYITAAYWFTASTSFANPAVTIARALTNTFAGIAPGDVADVCGRADRRRARRHDVLMGWLLVRQSRSSTILEIPLTRSLGRLVIFP